MSSFHPDILTGLIKAEAQRLGVEMDLRTMELFDFYEQMIADMRPADGFTVPDVPGGGDMEDYFNAVYLSCLLLFGKPGYMDVSVSEYFAPPEAAAFLKETAFKRLNRFRQKEAERLRKDYGSIQAITNPEMAFVVGLYEEAKA
jgi:hypothetical protein